MSGSQSPYREITNRTVLLAAVVVAVLGGALLFLGGNESLWHGHKGLQAGVNGIGGALFGAVALGFLWELVGKRALADEMYERFGTSSDVKTAGLVGIGSSYVSDPDWESYFSGVTRLDIVVAYAHTWRNQHLAQLREVASRADARIRVYLPDPEDTDGIAVLAYRFGYDVDRLKRNIEEARHEFMGLAVPHGADVQVLYRPAYSVFSFYRFDSIAVVTLYSHSRARQPNVPTFVCRSGGSLFKFVYEELAALRDMSRTP
ncbi:hypothetical protein [Actinomadura sp. 7K534]|uniref:hypothetical protein n=1 Tax=Actinomadura sp. 7K534 TaxID=2530366 RepID=UPI0010445DEF|nr:hypothetical protein [Actinomadura sp. 7K534]TDB96757.1 hypothetical protein E1266_08795 [Actinomadura sp. 7K534]